MVVNLSQKRDEYVIGENTEESRSEEKGSIDAVRESERENGYDVGTKDKASEVTKHEMVYKKNGSYVNATKRYKMSLPEVTYRLKRMLGRYGLKETVDNANGCWLFKYGYKEGLNNFVELSPWMVNGKPLMVQKRNPEIGIEKTGHSKVALWVEFTNVPMEAWSIDGLSAISSSVGSQ
ncbi:zinc knuckle CX2CX4HX4C [Artemisia annua]|uniref:Zinc knuckle CX2CX4HX4C n=1 Tax=Artemisia annua TaxID=35608 RepID=A0A2U1NUJ8_ARTAN|nr:zinc knuckle CX2CX4HX4C [Artemisia annua]